MINRIDILWDKDCFVVCIMKVGTYIAGYRLLVCCFHHDWEVGTCWYWIDKLWEMYYSVVCIMKGSLEHVGIEGDILISQQ